MGISKPRYPHAATETNAAWLRSALKWCAVAPLPLLLTACNWALLDPRGPVGQAERTILIDSLAIMLAIGIPTILATFAFAWWFRASNKRAQYRPDWEFSGAIELVVWSIPAMTIILLGGVAWLSSYALDPAEPIEAHPSSARSEPLAIQAVSLDWKWLFIYPREGIASVNELVVPTGVPLHFSLTSASVWNTFFVPQLGSMIYTMNGMRTQLYLRADEPGIYRGMSAHFSGDGFPDMHFPVRAVSLAEFDAWSTSKRGSGPTLDAASYATLAQQGTVRPSTYGSVASGLFDQVVTHKIPPGPGPTTDRGGAAEKSPKSQ